MKRGPSQNKMTTVDHVAKARAAWGTAIPDWIAALAQACTDTSQATVARKFDLSSSVISETLANKYTQKGGKTDRLEELVRGAFMGASVTCPVLGNLSRDRCLDEQKQPFRATSALRTRLFHACQKCPQKFRKGG